MRARDGHPPDPAGPNPTHPNPAHPNPAPPNPGDLTGPRSAQVSAGPGTTRPTDTARPAGRSAATPTPDREILALAVPALGALVAEPLFLLADSAIVGRLGTVPLAGLGIAAAVLATAVNVFVFLAYGTTAAVARRIGSGDRAAAVGQGIDGMWLAVLLGAATSLAGWAAAGRVVGLFHAEPQVAEQAVTYLRWSLPGLPAMLVVLAATGVLRGLQDTRTPLAVAATGSAVNAGLNLLLVHGLRLGIAGSALGTALTQVGMAAALVVVVVRGARRLGAPMRPDRAGVWASGRSGVPLLVRTLALRAALLATTNAAAAQSAAGLAAYQVSSTVWTLLALALDALAIAGQALTGRALGAGDIRGARAATRRMLVWGVGAGAVFGALLLLGRDLVPAAFTHDPAVRRALLAALVVVAVAQPLCGYVFVLDGVLIGAGDGRFLAVAGVVQVVGYLPLTVAVVRLAPTGTMGLVWLWIAFAGGYMLLRAVFLGLRERSDAWLVTGATR
ncbi:MAG TPA: MATE family efflux transporter [Kineosporiaceae bacterium]|nr:MATE family efflux transporter [Kineosporiaceae bacterium]